MSTASDITNALAALAAVVADSAMWAATASSLNVARYTGGAASDIAAARAADATAIANSAALAATALAALNALVLDA